MHLPGFLALSNWVASLLAGLDTRLLQAVRYRMASKQSQSSVTSEAIEEGYMTMLISIGRKSR